MVIRRGGIHWTDFGQPRGSAPGFRRPVLVIQSDDYNRSRLSTTLVAIVTSNTDLAVRPGNVFVPAAASGLAKDSVVNVTGLMTVDKSDLEGEVGRIGPDLMGEVDRGLRRVLGL